MLAGFFFLILFFHEKYGGMSRHPLESNLETFLLKGCFDLTKSKMFEQGIGASWLFSN